MADAKTSKTSSDVETITVPVDPNMDADTREALIRDLAPKGGEGIVGNLADIQRAGAMIVKGEGKGLADGVETPPGVTDEDIATAKKVDEAVAAAVESAQPASAGDPHTGDTGGTTASRSS